MNGFIQSIGLERYITSAIVTTTLDAQSKQLLHDLCHLQSLELIGDAKGAPLPSAALPRLLGRHALSSLYLREYSLADGDCQAIAGEESIEQFKTP
jgi:hypothetical protein